MRFAILGWFRAEIDGRPIDVERPRWRSVLAFLLVNADRPVSTDKIVSAVWGDRPVPTAATQVHTAVSSLRRMFRQHGAPDIIHNGPSGYVVPVPPGGLDLSEFSTALAASRRSAAESVADLRRALDLWRGPALDGVDGAFVDAVRTRLEEERLSAFERLVDLETARGRHRDVVTEIVGHLDEHPLRESLVRRLMLAMYHSGRKSDALREYARLRERLTAEIGVEPGPELRELHLEILRDGPRERPADRGGRFPPPGPSRLPPPSAAFTGRAAELARVRRALSDGSGARVIALHGPGGVGKSALALAVAHDVASSFPGGQIHVDLRGSTPGMRPLSSHEVIRRCLVRLGVAERDVPVDDVEAVRRLRDLGRAARVLVVLDNVVSVAQIRPILDAAVPGAVIVTSRAPLPLDAAPSLRLDRLSPSESIALLDRVSGRSGADWSELGLIAAHCDHLPLALCIAGGRLAREPDLSAGRLAAGLADHRSRLDSLEVDGVGVRSSIRVGYDLVEAGVSATDRLATAAFHAIGVLPLPSFDAGVIAAALRVDGTAPCDAALTRLARAQLVVPDGDGRHRVHDMVRSVAAERAEEAMTAADRRALQGRAVAYYAACAVHADELLRPSRRAAPRRLAPAVLADPRLVDHVLRDGDDVGPWLDASLPSVLAASRLAVSLGGDHAAHAVTLIDSLSWTLRKRGEFHRAHALGLAAVEGAEGRDDAAALRRALLHLGRVEIYLGRSESATVHIDRALVSARADGDVYAQVAALNDLSLAMIRQDDLPAARALLVESIDIVAPTEARVRIGLTAVHNLAVVEALLGEWDRAADRLAGAIVARREIGDRAGEGADLALLGVIRCGAGRVDAAVADLVLGLDICDELGNRSDAWFALAGLAIAHLRQGRHLEAVAVGLRCLAAARAVARPTAERAAHRILSRAYEAASEAADARLHARRLAAIPTTVPVPEDDLVMRIVDGLPG